MFSTVPERKEYDFCDVCHWPETFYLRSCRDSVCDFLGQIFAQ